MWIERDITALLQKTQGSLIQIVIGPRQCGKSSLLAHLNTPNFGEASLDDLQLRTLANRDPALFLEQHPPPLMIDEVQYAPNLFPELKRIVDTSKRQQLYAKNKSATPSVSFRLTGSNQILMDKQVKESLVGRASYYYLNTLTVREIQRSFPHIPIADLLFTGGWPELYTNKNLSVTRYLNDYIRHYIEKDITQSAGITKQLEFHTVLGMLAARTAQFLNYSSIAKDSGVKSVTVKEWVSFLEKTQLIYLLHPYENNLNKRLLKSPKIYFLDTGLAVRLQGWAERDPLLKSPQAGHLFESLVLAEIIKFKENYDKPWQVFVWRLRDGEEIDFVIDNGRGDVLAIDAKMGIHSVQPQSLPPVFAKTFGRHRDLILVSLGGSKTYLAKNCLQLPLRQLGDLLEDF